jgi:hypothetical protein
MPQTYIRAPSGFQCQDPSDRAVQEGTQRALRGRCHWLVSIMCTSRVSAECMHVEREGNYAHAHYTGTDNYYCLTDNTYVSCRSLYCRLT